MSQAPRLMRRRTRHGDGAFLGYTFWCPGCENRHVFYLENEKLVWKFDGNLDSPSFSPSLLGEWTEGTEKTKKRCHLFIKNGQIQFCGDCTHDLAGKTVEMVEGEW